MVTVRPSTVHPVVAAASRPSAATTSGSSGAWMEARSGRSTPGGAGSSPSAARNRAAAGTSTALPGWLIVRIASAVGASKRSLTTTVPCSVLAPGELGDRRGRDRADAPPR